ncbi:hypothetical protein [Streptomyces sp. NPDC018972]
MNGTGGPPPVPFRVFDHRVLDAGPFGELIKLPAPFDLVIDTAGFPET